MSPLFNHLLIPFIIAMALAITMGGSGTGPAFSVAYGSNVIKKSLIPGLFGIMVFLGAILAGKGTANTLGNELLNPDFMNYTLVSIVLFSVTIAMLVANLAGIPQSTSQATVMAITAPALYYNELNSNKLLFEIIPTWFILPIISFALCFLFGKYIYVPMRKRGYLLSKAFNESKIVKGLIILMSLYVAFSIGANNVANASGPIASMTINELGLSNENSNFIIVMILTTLVVAPSFGLGSSLFGQKILHNTGKEIILFGKFEAIFIAFITASLLILASVTKGIPSSLVQLNVAGIIGFGVAKLGSKNIFKKTAVNKFFFIWLLSPIISFSLCFFLIWLADKQGLLNF